MDEKALKELLLRDNAAFRGLHEEHQACEKRLDELRSKGFLTEEERLDERELKKRKLALKDRMYVMMSDFRKAR